MEVYKKSHKKSTKSIRRPREIQRTRKTLKNAAANTIKPSKTISTNNAKNKKKPAVKSAPKNSKDSKLKQAPEKEVNPLLKINPYATSGSEDEDMLNDALFDDGSMAPSIRINHRLRKNKSFLNRQILVKIRRRNTVNTLKVRLQPKHWTNLSIILSAHCSS